MSERAFDPLRLDVAAFAKAAGELEGSWEIEQLARLAESRPTGAEDAGHSNVVWHARGEWRPVRGAASEVWLHVGATTALTLECQRCLRGVDTTLAIDRRFLFVHGEDAAAQLDADSEDDVLALTRALDLRELVEDELLLALPLVPRHDVCPVPLEAPAGPEVADDDAEPHPFAGLAALKSSGRAN